MKREKHFVECECGAKVYGSSVLHAKKNLPAHKKSKKHKELMEIKQKDDKRK